MNEKNNKQILKKFAIYFSKKNIDEIIRKNNFNKIEDLFENIMDPIKGPKKEQIKKVFKKHTENNYFTLIYLPYKNKILISSAELFTPKERNNYNFLDSNLYFYDYNILIRKEKLKNL